jgi:tetratricopeptide (TPR) repeat protein
MLKGKLIGACLIAVILGCCLLAQAQTMTVSQFARALLATKTDREQDSLLAANKALVTQELCDTVFQAGLSFAGKQAWPQSLNSYQLSIKIARLIDSKTPEGNALAEIGNNLFDQADYDKSLDYFQKSLALRKEIGKQDGIASALLHIARIHRKRDDYTLALDHLDQARTLVGAVKDKNVIAGIELETGSVDSTRGDYTAAVIRFKTALGIFQETKSHSDVGLTLNALATAYSFLGDFDQAREYTRQALAEAGENKTVAVRALLTVGVTYGQ